MDREHSMGERSSRRGLVAELLSGILSSVIDLVEGTVEGFVREQKRRIAKKASIAALFFVGVAFLLNALALFISDYLGQASWVGYGVVGGGAVLLASIFWKE